MVALTVVHHFCWWHHLLVSFMLRNWGRHFFLFLCFCYNLVFLFEEDFFVFVLGHWLVVKEHCLVFLVGARCLLNLFNVGLLNDVARLMLKAISNLLFKHLDLALISLVTLQFWLAWSEILLAGKLLLDQLILDLLPLGIVVRAHGVLNDFDGLAGWRLHLIAIVGGVIIL